MFQSAEGTKFIQFWGAGGWMSILPLTFSGCLHPFNCFFLSICDTSIVPGPVVTSQSAVSDSAVSISSPVTSSKSLSPHTRTRSRGAKVPGFPQRVTSVSSVCEGSVVQRIPEFIKSPNSGTDKKCDSAAATVSKQHNLSLQLLGNNCTVESHNCVTFSFANVNQDPLRRLKS